MNAYQELLAKKAKEAPAQSGSDTLKAKDADFNIDDKTGIATLNADFDVSAIVTSGKATSSGKERFANVTIRIPNSPIRFTGNCFVKV